MSAENEKDTVQDAFQRGQKLGLAKVEEIEDQIEAIRTEAQVFGMIKKIDHDLEYNRLLKFAALSKLKEQKTYRQAGMTWVQFCDSIGESSRTVDAALADIKPFTDKFSASFTALPLFSNLSFSKIKYLGRKISANSAGIEDGMLIVGDQKISLVSENKDEIEALIDSLKEQSCQQEEEAAATLRAKDRTLESKEQVINKQEKEIARLEARGFALGEEKFLRQLEAIKVSIDDYFRIFDYETAGSVRSDITPRMKVATLETLAYIRKMAAITHEDIKNLFGEMEEPWDPDAEIAAFEEEQRQNSRDT